MSSEVQFVATLQFQGKTLLTKFIPGLGESIIPRVGHVVLILEIYFLYAPMIKMAYQTVIHKNPDKAGATPSVDGILPAHPFRWGLFSGGPGRGKRNLVLCVLHHIMTKDAPYDTITVIHLDKTSKEYEILEDSAPVFRLLTIEEDGVPTPETWSPDERNLLVIDEINHGGLSRAETGALSRLFGYAHRRIRT